MKAFPRQLTQEEEDEYLLRYAANDMQARQILIEHNLRLVAHIVKKYNCTQRDCEDMLSIGTIGLIKAIDSFDANKGIKLATYAARCIENELLMMFRQEKKQSKDVFMYENIGTDKEGNEISLIDVIENDSEDIAESISRKQCAQKIMKSIKGILSDREFEIIVLRYGLYGYQEMTQNDIANKLGISRSYVSRIEKKAIEKLRQLI